MRSRLSIESEVLEEVEVVREPVGVTYSLLITRPVILRNRNHKIYGRMLISQKERVHYFLFSGRHVPHGPVGSFRRP